MDCNSKILAVDYVFPTEKLCSILGTEPDDKVLRTSRLIFLKEKPLAWTQTYLVVSDDFQPSARELEEAE